jgi:putative FmdB family regulatory protein
MPIYEYHCPRCDEDFEELVRNKDEKVVCPKCNCKKVSKKMSVFGFKSGNKYVSSSEGAGGCASCKASSCAGCK